MADKEYVVGRVEFGPAGKQMPDISKWRVAPPAIHCIDGVDAVYARFQHLDALFRAIGEDSADPIHKACKEMWLAISAAAHRTASNVVFSDGGEKAQPKE